MNQRKIVTENEEFPNALGQRVLAKSILDNPESQFILLAVTGDKRQACAFLTANNIGAFMELLLVAVENTCE